MHAEDYGYCECGCGGRTPPARKTNSRQGQVKGKPNRFLLGHSSRKLGPKYKLDSNGCWVWLGAKDRNGYGHMRVSRTSLRTAHRVYYEEAKGPIPEGLELDHLCRNPSCVNPDHLEAITHKQNIRRGRNTKLTIEDVREIRSRPRSYGSIIALAREFNVKPACIREVVNGRTWVDVTDAA